MSSHGLCKELVLSLHFFSCKNFFPPTYLHIPSLLLYLWPINTGIFKNTFRGIFVHNIGSGWWRWVPNLSPVGGFVPTPHSDNEWRGEDLTCWGKYFLYCYTFNVVLMLTRSPREEQRLDNWVSLFITLHCIALRQNKLIPLDRGWESWPRHFMNLNWHKWVDKKFVILRRL